MHLSKHIVTWLAACCLVLLTFQDAFAQAELTPDVYRIKIDHVDVSKAPDVKISATFLDRRSLPVSPQKVDRVEVLADGDVLPLSPKITTFKDGDIPLDLAFIVPISKRFSDKELKEIKDRFALIIDQARDNDRMAGYFDDGRAINVAPLGPAKDVAEVLKKTQPQASPSFLYSSLELAMEDMIDPAKMRSPARRAIILVTDAFDTYTFRADDVQREIYEIYRLANANDIRIYVVMYKPFIRPLIPLFEGLSRKTGGTYRYADFPEQISDSINYAWGEIYGQLEIHFRHNGLREGQDVVYSIEAMREGGIHVKSDPFREIRIEQLRFNWRLFAIVMGIIAGVLVIALIVFLIIRHRRKKRAEEEAAREEQIILEKIERGEVCPKCRRTMMKDWTECMFCAREAAEEINKVKAEQRQKALEEAEKKGIKLEGKICSKCNRTMMPQWKDCLFCKAGIGADGGGGKPKAGVAPMGKKEEKKEAAARACPVCSREMKAHWQTCLFCEADKSQQMATAPPPKQEASNVPQAKICPDCGREMKAHWDVCLFCEANAARH